MFLKNISDCLCADRVGDNGIDMVGSLNSIGSLASSDLGDNRVGIGRRKFRRAARRRVLSIGIKVFKYSGDSRLTNTSFSSNITSRIVV